MSKQRAKSPLDCYGCFAMATTADNSARIAVVILAAGSSSRLGQPKQLLPMHGSTLLRVIAQQACATGAAVAVVLGAGAHAIAPTLEGLPLAMLDNPAWPEGISSSIRVAVAWAERNSCGGCALLVGDQPLFTAAHLARLLTTYRSAGGGIVASRYRDVVGVPAVFDRAWFATLAGLQGPRGAQQVIRSAAVTSTVVIDWPDGAIDLDTVDDLAAWSQR